MDIAVLNAYPILNLQRGWLNERFSGAGDACSLLRRVFGVVLLGLLLTGCAHNMHRRMTIRSEPPGALVLMEGEEIGYTPVSMDFDHYGTREITLIKDGYETITAMQKVRTPWHQTVGVDLVTDNFSPVKINDRMEYTFTLNKQELVSNDQLIQRGTDLRNQARGLPQPPEP